jgi:hypothetical protein
MTAPFFRPDEILFLAVGLSRGDDTGTSGRP